MTTVDVPVSRTTGLRIFYVSAAVAIAISVFVGFARTYYLRPYFYPTTLPPLAQLHGAVFTAWILLFLIQGSLVAGGRVALHRRLGLAGAALAALVVATGVAMAVSSGKQHFAAGDAGALAFLAIPFTDMLVFGIFAALAIWQRRRPATHKRLMFLATVSILGAALARWPVGLVANGPTAFFTTMDLFIVAGALYDVVTLRRLHQATLWGGSFLVLSQFLRFGIAGTAGWQAVARAILR